MPACTTVCTVQPAFLSRVDHLVEIKESVTRLPTTAEPRRPLRAAFRRIVTASSTTSTIWSTIIPTLRSPSLKTTTALDWATDRCREYRVPGQPGERPKRECDPGIESPVPARVLNGRPRELLEPGDE